MTGIRVIAMAGAAIMVLGLSMAFMGIGAQAVAAQVGAPVPLPYDNPVSAGWTLVGAAVSLVVSLIVAMAKYVGVVIGAEARERLHSAVMSWARAAVARGLTMDEARAMLPDYLEQSIADTMRRLKPFGKVLNVLFDGKYEIAKAETLSGFLAVEGAIAEREKPARR